MFLTAATMYLSTETLSLFTHMQRNVIYFAPFSSQRRRISLFSEPSGTMQDAMAAFGFGSGPQGTDINKSVLFSDDG